MKAGKGQKETYDRNIDQINKVQSVAIVPNDKQGKPFTGWINYNSSIKNAQDMISQNQGFAQKMNEEANSFFGPNGIYQQERTALNAMENLYANTDTNRLSPEMAKVVGELSSIPIIQSLVPNELKTFQGATDEAQKLAAFQAINQAIDAHLNRAPATGLNMEQKTVAGPERAPGARFNLTVQQEANLQRKKDIYQSWLNDNKGGNINDVSQWTNDWSSDQSHSVDKYNKNAVNNVPYFKGMTPEEKARAVSMGRSSKNWEDNQLVPIRPEDVANLPPEQQAAARGKYGYWNAKTKRIEYKPH